MARGEVSLKEALVISRPLLWIVTAVPFIAAAFLSKKELSLTLFVGALYFLMPYNLLLYGLGGIFARQGSADSAVSRIKHPSLWRWIAGANIPFILYFALAGNIESTVFLIMMIYLAVAYNATGLKYKEIPFIDSLTSGFIYSSPFLFALFLFKSPDLWAPAFSGLYFWAVGNHAFGSIKNIAADREAGSKSIATYLGARKTITFCIAAYALAVIAPVLGYGIKGLAVAAGAAALTYLYNR